MWYFTSLFGKSYALELAQVLSERGAFGGVKGRVLSHSLI